MIMQVAPSQSLKLFEASLKMGLLLIEPLNFTGMPERKQDSLDLEILLVNTKNKIRMLLG